MRGYFATRRQRSHTLRGYHATADDSHTLRGYIATRRQRGCRVSDQPLLRVLQAEERERQEQEERRQQLAAQRLLEAEKARSASSSGVHKKKGKHKEERQQKAAAMAGAGGPSGEDVLRDSQAKTVGKGKQRLKDVQPENQAEKFGGVGSQELTASNSKVPAVKPEATPAAAPSPARVGKEAFANNKVLKKSVEVFQPPAHLMRSLAEQSLQQASSRACAPPATSSPSPLPTLGGQPNSPTAKKAKRRLTPGTQGQLPAQRKLLLQQPLDLHQVELQRRIEAKEDVAKQIKEVEMFAHQQSQLRQQLHHSHLQHLHQTQNLQQQKQEQLQQLELQHIAAQQKKLFQQQIQQKQKQAQPAQPAQPAPQQQQQQQQKQQQQQAPQKQAVTPRQPAAGKQSPTAPQQSKPATNGVLGRHLSMGANHGKLVNGVGAVARAPQPLPASSPCSVSEAARGKQLPSGTNGLTPLENRARLANTAHRASAEHHDQGEQVRMVPALVHTGHMV